MFSCDVCMCYRHENVTFVTLRFVVMSIEPLFSASPFTVTSDNATTTTTNATQDHGVATKSFHSIRPHNTATITITQPGTASSTTTTTTYPIPPQFLHANIFVSAVGDDGVSASTTRFATTMRVIVRANYGEAKVVSARTGKPLRGVYVKVFSRTSDSDVGTFYKDGHTDVRGVFKCVCSSFVGMWRGICVFRAHWAGLLFFAAMWI